MIYRIAPRSKFGRKLVANYRFRSPVDRDNYVVRFMLQQDKIQAEKQAEKQKRKEAIANFVNPYQVGDLMYCSWGYEQTNIDFYQIVEVKKKSIVIRRVGQILVKAAGDMCEYVKPDKDNFIGGPIFRPIVFTRSGTPYINGRHGHTIRPYDKGDDGLYQSHYA